MSEYEHNDEFPAPPRPEGVEGDPIYLGQIYDYATLKSNKVHEVTPLTLANDDSEGADLKFSDAVEDTDFTPIRSMVLGTNVPPYAIAFSAGDRLVVPGGGVAYYTATAIVSVRWPWASGAPRITLNGTAASTVANLPQPLPGGPTVGLVKIDDYTWKLTAQIAVATPGINPKSVHVDLYATCHVRYTSRFDFTTEGRQAPAWNATDNLPVPDGGTLAGDMSGGVLDLGTIAMDGNCGEYNCYSFKYEDSTTLFYYTTEGSTNIGIMGTSRGDYGWHLASEWGEIDLFVGGGARDGYGATWRHVIGGDLWEITFDLQASQVNHSLTVSVAACKLITDNLNPDNTTNTQSYIHPEVYGWNGIGWQWYPDCVGGGTFTGTFATPQFLDRAAAFTLAVPFAAGNGDGMDVGGVMTPMGHRDAPGSGTNPIGIIPCSNPCNFTFTQTWRGWPQQAQMPIPPTITPQYPPYPPRAASINYGVSGTVPPTV
jgi:hypothetical protein